MVEGCVEDGRTVIYIINKSFHFFFFALLLSCLRRSGFSVLCFLFLFSFFFFLFSFFISIRSAPSLDWNR